MKPLRIAVVGVGHMGRHHAEKVAALARAGIGVELVGVADIDPDCAGAVASALDTRAVRDARELFP